MRPASHDERGPDTRKGVKIFLTDYAMFIAGTAAALFAHDPLLRILGSVFAGMKMNGLYTLGHDAGHGVLTGSRRPNKAISGSCSPKFTSGGR